MKGSLCRLAETSFLWRDTAMRIRERFNPRAPCGARRLCTVRHRAYHNFNPRAPCGARLKEFNRGGSDIFQPTRPLRGATQLHLSLILKYQNFNPRAPCGARHTVSLQPASRPYFNPRAPCGARHLNKLQIHGERLFQPTRPLRGATKEQKPQAKDDKEFQPTRPLRGATYGERWPR